MIHYCVQGRVPVHFPVRFLPRIARECSLTRASLRPKPHEISLSFLTPRAIQKLNTTYRGIHRPTDVLSFSPKIGASSDTPSSKALRGTGERGARIFPTHYALRTTHQPTDLGDLFICPQYVFAEAKRRQEEPGTALIRMVVHGTLHLLGFDHGTAKEEKRMFGVQERIIEKCLNLLRSSPVFRASV
jgi:probable rRNA maturation factor